MVVVVLLYHVMQRGDRVQGVALGPVQEGAAEFQRLVVGLAASVGQDGRFGPSANVIVTFEDCHVAFRGEKRCRA